MRSFRLLKIAISSKSREMLISLQFLAIVTIMLSFVLFFYEHAVQPDVYDNGWKSVVWAFAQYIGDPGGFADTPPITFAGKMIATVIGILGIALFAVPAGLIGAGFSEAMENELHKEDVADNIEKLRKAFERKPWPSVPAAAAPPAPLHSGAARHSPPAASPHRQNGLPYLPPSLQWRCLRRGRGRR